MLNVVSVDIFNGLFQSGYVPTSIVGEIVNNLGNLGRSSEENRAMVANFQEKFPNVSLEDIDSIMDMLIKSLENDNE